MATDTPLNIAIIGANGVGKSALIQAALKFTRKPSNLTSVRLEIDGEPCKVMISELDLEAFDVDPTEPIRWPKQVNGHIAPRIDGTMVLYDVMNKESIKELPPALSALSLSGQPVILVATKCDNPESLRQLNASEMASTFPFVVGHYKTSYNVPGSARECMVAMLRAALASRKGNEAAGHRRRAASTANLEPMPESGTNGRPPRPESEHSRHSRASSDLSLLRGFQQHSNEGYHRGSSTRSPRLPHTASTYGGDDVSSNVEGSDSESYRYSDEIPILQRSDDSFIERPVKPAGVSFDELVDRLLAQRMTKADHNFADVFLCLYRKFAAPGKLFSAILTRLERAKDDKPQHYLTKISTQLRIIEVVAKWVSLYPGDFAGPATKRTLERFVQHLATEPAFSAAASQMKEQLESCVFEDDDTWWACADEKPEEAASTGTPLARVKSHDLDTSLGSLNMRDSESAELRRPSQGSEVSQTGQDRSVKDMSQFQTVEDYEHEAATMIPQGTLPLNKFRYHIFMDVNADDMADEITRIDWVMFSSVKIRDLVRDVSLTPAEKEKCRSLKNSKRMTQHFNHLADWVKNMVLIRDKAKHRAPCLEKFIQIAIRLRKLNNYYGLAAVMAGIQANPIIRLAATWDMLDPNMTKKFNSLYRLLSTEKSSYSYRLAWENSGCPRIPYLPLHKKDLVATEHGGKTFVGPNGDRINWKKFEVLGEILLPIMKSHGTPYPNLHKHEMCRELILDCRMEKDEEALFQRSCAVEGGSGGAADSGKRVRFPWTRS